MFLASTQIPLLEDIIIIFALSTIVVYIFNKIKIPPIVGFLLTGIIAGPYAAGLIDSGENVTILAEIGVILILFSIGLEFSVSKLLRIKKNILLGGTTQVFLTIAVVTLIALYFDFPLNQSVFLGFITALSSTAIILKLHQSASSLDSPQGSITLAILIHQDIIILPMFLLIPILAGHSDNMTTSILLMIAKALGIFVFMWLSVKYLMPQLMYQIAKTRIKELFLISILLICLAVVWLAGIAGISLALGAFIAGIIISETEYSREALSFVEPFRDVFSSFFFVSIGMLLNLTFLGEHIKLVLMLVFGLIFLKLITGTIATLVLSYPLRTSIISGTILAQIGEFSFVLALVGMTEGLITDSIYQLFLSTAVISMILSPFLFRSSKFINIIFEKSKLLKRFNKARLADEHKTNMQDHLVIIGYGPSGRNLAKAANFAGLEFAVIEMNPVTVREESAKGIHIYYGDATNEAILDHVNISAARVAVIAVSDPAAVRAATERIRKHNPNIYLIARTRFLSEVEPLYDMGANEVIPEEFESSVEIFTRVLNHYLIPKSEIDKFTLEMRAGCYKMLRNSSDTTTFEDFKNHIPDYEITTFRIPDDSPLDNHTLGELELRSRYKITVLGIRRADKKMIVNPQGTTKLHNSDLLIMFAKPEDIHSANEAFKY